jgi:hypothetical protein
MSFETTELGNSGFPADGDRFSVTMSAASVRMSCPIKTMEILRIKMEKMRISVLLLKLNQAKDDTLTLRCP